MLTRRTLLAGAGATLLSGCTADHHHGERPRAAAGASAERDAAIFDLSFTEMHRYRPVHVVAPGFVDEHRSDVGETGTTVRSSASPSAPFAAVEVDLVSGDDGVVVAGLSTEDDDRVVVSCNGSSGAVTLEVRAGGRTRVLRRKKVDLTGVRTFAFALCENQVTALVRRGQEWQPVLTERTKVARLVDLRAPETLAGFAYTWGVRSGSAVLGDVRAGLFGMTGLRDPHLVQHADGTPFVRDGKVYLTWTCAGLGFFQQAHWGVFTLDLEDPTRLEQVAQLFSHRDGMLVGDHAGQLVRDGDRWLVATSSWGDFGTPRPGVHVRHLTTTDDLLIGVHLLETEPTDLPTDVGSWDPGFTRVDGRWLLGFVESPSQDPFDFHPALAATGDRTPWTGLTKIGAAGDLHQCEGPVLAQVDGRWWFLASDGDARHYPVFDVTMRRVGRLDAPYPTNIPHPQLLRHPTRPGTWWMVSFDGTQFHPRTMGYGGHGDVVVMTAQG